MPGQRRSVSQTPTDSMSKRGLTPQQYGGLAPAGVIIDAEEALIGKRSRPKLTMRFVIGMFSAFIVLAVSAVTFAITYTSSLSTVESIGNSYARSLVETARSQVEAAFNVPASHLLAMQLEGKQEGLYSFPSEDPTDFTVLQRASDRLYSMLLQMPDTLFLSHFIFDDGSRASVGRPTAISVPIFAKFMMNSRTITDTTTRCCGIGLSQGWLYPGMARYPGTLTQVLTDSRIAAYTTPRRFLLTMMNGGIWGTVTYNTQVTPPQFALPAICPVHNASGTFLGGVAAAIGLQQMTRLLQGLVVTPNTVIFALDASGAVVSTTHGTPFIDITNTTATSTTRANCYNTFGTTGAVPSGIYQLACRSLAKDFPYADLQRVAGDKAFMRPDAKKEPLVQHVGDTIVVATGISNGLGDFPLSLLLFMPQSDILGDIVRSRNTVIGIVCAVIVVASFASVVLTSRVLSALSRVSTKMRMTARLRDVDDDPDMSRLSEIYDIESAYRGMNMAIRSFTRYVPRDVVKDLMATGDLCSLQMKQHRCSMLFIDIAGFTTICERVPPDEMSGLIHVYFSRMTHLVMTHDGVVDKFIGDCVMAVWGAPTAAANMEAKATLCALRMSRETRVAPLCNAFDDAGEVLSVRVGVASGAVLAGNMGCDERMNFTVIGDAVNLSSRLEAFNKQVGTEVLVCAETAAKLYGAFCLRFLMQLQVVGKNIAVAIYEIVGLAGPTLCAEAHDHFRRFDGNHVNLNDTLSTISGGTGSMMSAGSGSERGRVESTVRLFDEAARLVEAPVVVSEARAEEARLFSDAARLYTKGEFARALEMLHAERTELSYGETKCYSLLANACSEQLLHPSPAGEFMGTIRAVEK
jgi:class 3 adenylate cyclase